MFAIIKNFYCRMRQYGILEEAQTNTRQSQPWTCIEVMILLLIGYSAISRSIRDYFHVRERLSDHSYGGESIGGIVRLSFIHQRLSKACLPDLFVHVVALNTTMPFE